MSKLFGPQEIYRLTGITPKIINDYKDVVKPTSYKENLIYKQYDEKAVNKFRQIAIYRELGLKRTKIKEILEDPNYDSNLALDELIVLLQEKKKHLERLILSVEQMQAFGTKNGVPNIITQGKSLEQNGANLEKLFNSSYFQKITTNLEGFEALIDTYFTQVESALIEFLMLDDSECANKKCFDLIKILVDEAVKQLGFIGYSFFLDLSISAQGQGSYWKEINEDFEGELTVTKCEAVLKYLKRGWRAFEGELTTVIEENSACIGSDFSDVRVIKLVSETKTLAHKYFGFTTDKEYQFLFSTMEINPYSEKSDNINFILNAIKYSVSSNK